MRTLINFAQLGTIDNVLIDWSFGYHSFISGLKYIGERQISERVTNLISMLCKHGEKYFQNLNKT